jgi:hypothetical protein
MSALNRSFIVLAFTSVAACATTGHKAMNGSVVMKLSDTQAHVCLFEQDAPVGAQVQLYRHDCVGQYDKSGAPYGRTPFSCKKEAVAIGTIAQKMGGHYALVTFPQGTQYEEGYTVEPIP